MKSISMVFYVLLVLSCSIYAAPQKPVPTWTDSDKALQDVPDFELVGEYVALAGGHALQATLLKDGQILCAQYQGGLPGLGWDKTKIKSRVMKAEAFCELKQGYMKIVRTSPTMGKKAPEDAILSFPEDFTNTKEGLLFVPAKTQKDISSFVMHLEYRLPFKPGRNPSSQDRGNSGIYIFNNYEVQVIDSFALDLDSENNAISLESKNTQWCGALYKAKTPDTHMAFPPLCWQTYDIHFQAPVFEGKTKVKNARITVFHNGVKIHDDVELTTGTGAGAKRPQVATGPIFFQGHGNPVIYRNVWATALAD